MLSQNSAAVFVLVGLVSGAGAAHGNSPDSRTVIGTNYYLAEGAQAIRMGNYNEGIRLTELGLKTSQPTSKDRAAALCNLCAAHAALREPDRAIELCTESLALNNRNWRTYSNRAAAYTIKGLYSEAVFDLDAAEAINPNGRAVRKLRGILNELRLRPTVIMEDHQESGLLAE